MAATTTSRERQPWCALRPGEACTLCSPGSSGPETCPTLYHVMHDPELREQLLALRAEAGLEPDPYVELRAASADPEERPQP